MGVEYSPSRAQRVRERLARRRASFTNGSEVRIYDREGNLLRVEKPRNRRRDVRKLPRSPLAGLG